MGGMEDTKCGLRGILIFWIILYQLYIHNDESLGGNGIEPDAVMDHWVLSL